jgi:hypothetical protein
MLESSTPTCSGVFHALHELLLSSASLGGDGGGDDSDNEAAREAGLEQLRLCEMGTADAFRRLLAGQNFHYLLTSATAVVLANVLVLLLQKLYSKAAADALQEAVKQAKNAPRNVRLYVAWCVGRALRACGHQLRPLHGEGAGSTSVQRGTVGVRRHHLGPEERGVLRPSFRSLSHVANSHVRHHFLAGLLTHPHLTSSGLAKGDAEGDGDTCTPSASAAHHRNR